MKLKTLWKTFFPDKKPRSLPEIWKLNESGQELTKEEYKLLIEKLKDLNIRNYNENMELKSYIQEMQYGFDYSQKQLVQKINSQ